MTRRITAVFDGKVLRPDQPVDLVENRHYTVTISEAIPDDRTGADAWELLDQATGSLEAPHDWAEEHDHYLYGAQKRGLAEAE
jgi:hypothetical protein